MRTLRGLTLVVVTIALLLSGIPAKMPIRLVRAQTTSPFQDEAAAFYAWFHCREPWPTAPVDVEQVACQLDDRLRAGGSWDVLVGKSLGLGALWGVGPGLSGSWVRGLYEGLASGMPARMRDIADEALFFAVVVVGGIVSSIAAVPAGGLAFACGWWAGTRWSARQVRDAELRWRLANPEVQAPESRAEPRE